MLGERPAHGDNFIAEMQLFGKSFLHDTESGVLGEHLLLAAKTKVQEQGTTGLEPLTSAMP